MQFLPPEYAWLEPVILAAVVVFIIDLVGNHIAFGNRVLNALVTSVLFGLVFAAAFYFGYADTLTNAIDAAADVAPQAGSGS